MIPATEKPYPRIVAERRRTYWEVAPGVFQATNGPHLTPVGEAGYGDLNALMKLKGDAR